MPALDFSNPGGVQNLGFGGDQLQQQVAGETDDERKKRLAAMAAKNAGLPQSPFGSVASLFGGGAQASAMSGFGGGYGGR